MTITTESAQKEPQSEKKVGQTGWQRITLLSVLGYEAAGALSCGSLLIAAPDGRLMDMPVDIMHGVFLLWVAVLAIFLLKNKNRISLGINFETGKMADMKRG